MNKYQLSFWFEHGGFCVWSKNDNAKEKYGYAVKNEALPISENLTNDLNALEDEYATFLDWENPANPSPWSEAHKTEFLNRANLIYKQLQEELGSEFEIENKVYQCIE